MGAMSRVCIFFRFAINQALSRKAIETSPSSRTSPPGGFAPINQALSRKAIETLRTREVQNPYQLASLRLNLFPDMKALLPETLDLSMWKVKDMVWSEDCPLPAGEDFRRIADLW